MLGIGLVVLEKREDVFGSLWGRGGGCRGGEEPGGRLEAATPDFSTDDFHAAMEGHGGEGMGNFVVIQCVNFATILLDKEVPVVLLREGESLFDSVECGVCYLLPVLGGALRGLPQEESGSV